MQKRARRGVAGVVALAAVAAVVGWWTFGFRAFTTDGAALAEAGPLPRPAPALDFWQTNGEQSSLEALRGKYVLLTFMYLHCPDVCHIVTARLHQAHGLLGDMVPERMVFLSLSLDPERDDAASLDEHWRMLDAGPGWVVGGLSTAQEQTAARDAALAKLGVWITHLPDGRINHAASSFLIDPSGQVVAVYRPEVSGDSLVKALRTLVQ